MHVAQEMDRAGVKVSTLFMPTKVSSCTLMIFSYLYYPNTQLGSVLRVFKGELKPGKRHFQLLTRICESLHQNTDPARTAKQTFFENARVSHSLWATRAFGASGLRAFREAIQGGKPTVLQSIMTSSFLAVFHRFTRSFLR